MLRSGPILPFVDDNDAAAEERERREGEWKSLWWQEIQFTVMVGLPPLARSGGWGKLSLHLQPCFRFTTSLSLPLDSFSSDGWEWEDGLRFPTGPSLILPPIDACLPSFRLSWTPPSLCHHTNFCRVTHAALKHVSYPSKLGHNPRRVHLRMERTFRGRNIGLSSG